MREQAGARTREPVDEPLCGLLGLFAEALHQSAQALELALQAFAALRQRALEVSGQRGHARFHVGHERVEPLADFSRGLLGLLAERLHEFAQGLQLAAPLLGKRLAPRVQFHAQRALHARGQGFDFLLDPVQRRGEARFEMVRGLREKLVQVGFEFLDGEVDFFIGRRALGHGRGQFVDAAAEPFAHGAQPVLEHVPAQRAHILDEGLAQRVGAPACRAALQPARA